MSTWSLKSRRPSTMLMFTFMMMNMSRFTPGTMKSKIHHQGLPVIFSHTRMLYPGTKPAHAGLPAFWNSFHRLAISTAK
jgi:hypothetical protein